MGSFFIEQYWVVFLYWVLLIAAILQKSTQYFDDVKIYFTLGNF